MPGSFVCSPRRVVCELQELAEFRQESTELKNQGVTIRRLEERARELEAALAEKARGLLAQLMLSIKQASVRLRWLRRGDAGPERAPWMWESLLAFQVGPLLSLHSTLCRAGR